MEKKNKSLHFLQFTNESNKCLRFLSGKLQMFLGSLVGQAVSIENYKKNLSILTYVSIGTRTLLHESPYQKHILICHFEYKVSMFVRSLFYNK